VDATMLRKQRTDLGNSPDDLWILRPTQLGSNKMASSNNTNNKPPEKPKKKKLEASAILSTLPIVGKNRKHQP
jgi:hypothetical protein